MAASTGLNAEQRDELSNLQGINTFFVNNATSYSTNEPLKAEVAELNSNIGEIQKAIPEKIKSTEADTEKKNTQKQLIANQYDSICSDTRSYAIKTKNADLAAAVNYKYSTLLKVPDDNFAPTIRTINNAIKPFLTDTTFKKYQITQADLDSGEARLVTFLSFLTGAPTTISELASAEENIENLFTPARDNKTQIGLLMRRYKANGKSPNSPFYEGWLSVKRVVRTGGKITILDGIITDAADGTKLIANVLVKNLITGKMVYSNLLGHYRIEKFRGGTFEFEFSVAGYKTKKVIITIKTGKHVNLDVALEKE